MREREAAERQAAALAAEEQAAVERAERAALAAVELEFQSEDPDDDGRPIKEEKETAQGQEVDRAGRRISDRRIT